MYFYNWRLNNARIPMCMHFANICCNHPFIVLPNNVSFVHLLTRNQIWFNSLPNGKILDWSKLKALAYDKTNMVQKFEFVDGMTENIEGKRENAGYHHFLLSSQCFQKSFILGGR